MEKLVRRTLVLILWIEIWWVAAEAVRLPLMLPGPLETGRALVQLVQTGAFWRTTGTTLLRVAAGYLFAVTAGVLLATGCHLSSGVSEVLSPFRSVIRATPVSSFIILVLLWLQRGKGWVPVVISFLTVLPIVWTAVQEALDNLDGQLLEMTNMYRFTRWKKLKFFYYPSVRPGLLAACVTGLGFAWKSGIAAELIAQPAFSIGGRLYDTKVTLQSEELFAWTLTVIVLSMALEAVLKRALQKRGGKRP